MIALSGGEGRRYCDREVAGVGDGGNVEDVNIFPFTAAPSGSGRLELWGTVAR
jgi:hypothetical protein